MVRVRKGKAGEHRKKTGKQSKNENATLEPIPLWTTS